jgi:hypothetical protein
MARSRPDPAVGQLSPVSSPMVSVIVVVAGAGGWFGSLSQLVRRRRR